MSLSGQMIGRADELEKQNIQDRCRENGKRMAVCVYEGKDNMVAGAQVYANVVSHSSGWWANLFCIHSSRILFVKWKILEMGLKYLANTQLFKLFLFSRFLFFFFRHWPKGRDLMCSLKHTQTILSGVSYEISFLKPELSILLQALSFISISPCEQLSDCLLCFPFPGTLVIR